MTPTTTYDVQTAGLGKRYGSFWALQDCTLDLPQGSITALVGANGAGKSTLLRLLAALARPSAGTSAVLGTQPAQTAPSLGRVGYLAQEVPLYKDFTVEDYRRFGKHLNAHWDDELFTSRLRQLGIPFDRPASKLSGGQRAQVALALALGKQPQLLLLDEPVAALDPLARRDFLRALSQAVADTSLTVIMSSHLLADLELICDHVIIMARGRVQLAGSIDTMLANHRLLVGPHAAAAEPAAGYTVISQTHTPRQSTLLVKLDGAAPPRGKWQVSEVTIEEIVLAYMGRDAAGTPATGEETL